MNEELLLNLLDKLAAIDSRLERLENATTAELQKLHVAVDTLTGEQQDEVLPTLHRIDAKMAALLEAQKLNVEILKVFSGDLIQH